MWPELQWFTFAHRTYSLGRSKWSLLQVLFFIISFRTIAFLIICIHSSKVLFLYFFSRLGESEGSYCTLATFPSETSSSENSSPSSTPPSTPLQEKTRKIQKQKFPSYGPPKQKNGSGMSVTSLRLKPIPREVSYDFFLQSLIDVYHLFQKNKQNTFVFQMCFNYRQSWPSLRCDGAQFFRLPNAYRNINYYNTRHSLKNVVRV